MERHLYHPLPLTPGQLALWAQSPIEDRWVREHLEFFPAGGPVEDMVAGGGMGRISPWALEAIAANRHLGEAAMGALCADPPAGDSFDWGLALAEPRWRGLWRNPSAPPDLVAAGAVAAAGHWAVWGRPAPESDGERREPAAEAMAAILANPALPAAAIARLGRHAATRSWLLANPSAPPEWRREIFGRAPGAGDDGPWVMAALGMGPEEFAAQMARVAGWQEEGDRRSFYLLRWGSPPPGRARDLCADSTDLAPMASNRRAPGDWIRALIRAYRDVPRDALLLPEAPRPTGEMLAGFGGWWWMFREVAQASWPDPLIADAALGCLDADLGRPHRDPDVARLACRLLQHPALAGAAARYRSHPVPDVRLGVAMNPALCDLALMREMAADRSPVVREAIAGHPLLVFHDAQRALARSSHPKIRAALGANPAATRYGALARGAREPLPEPFWPPRAGGGEEDEREPAFPPRRGAGVGAGAPGGMARG